MTNEVKTLLNEEMNRISALRLMQNNVYSLSGNLDPNQLKKVIKKQILGLKEDTLGLADLLLANEMEVSESSLISKKMI